MCTQLLTFKAQPDFQNEVRSSLDAWEGAQWEGMLCVCVQYEDTALLKAALYGHSEVCTLESFLVKLQNL